MTSKRHKSNHTNLWSNASSDSFYGAVKPKGVSDLSVKAGLDSFADLIAIESIIRSSTEILDVGAGYGRALHYLLSHSRGKVTAVEKNSDMFSELNSLFSQNSRVELANANILTYHPNKKFDLILHLWLGIGDFNPNEQAVLINKFSNLLSENGTIIIESISEEFALLESEEVEKNTFLFCVNGAQIYIQRPSKRDIDHFSKQAGLTLKEVIHYTTTCQRNRILYVLSKK